MFFGLLAFLAVQTIQAQDRFTIAFMPIEYDQDAISAIDAKMVLESVENAFVESRKFVVVDRNKIEEINKERNLQKTESFMDSKNLAEDGVSRGAGYLISTHIFSYRASEERKAGWSGSVQIQVKVIDVATGEIKATENIASELSKATKEDFVKKKFGDTFFNTGGQKSGKEELERLESKAKYREDAMVLALDRMQINTKVFANKNFPLLLNILEFGDKGKKISLTAGSDLGIALGDMLDLVVLQEVNVGGKIIHRRKKVGTVVISKVEDQNFSTAAIVSKEKEYKDLVTEESTLHVVTK